MNAARQVSKKKCIFRVIFFFASTFYTAASEFKKLRLSRGRSKEGISELNNVGLFRVELGARLH
jgi:hypothetical protein